MVRNDQDLFRVVTEMIQQEIETDLDTICDKNVSSENIKGNRDNALKWSKWYDFARRAAVVMRLHMLEATSMLQYCRQTWRGVVEHLTGMKICPCVEPFVVAANAVEAREITRRFDEIFQPIALARYFQDMKPSDTRPYGPLDGPVLHLIDLQSRIRYEILAHLLVTLMDRSDEGLVITAKPYVSVLRYTFVLRPNDAHLNYNMLLRHVEDQEREVEFLNEEFARLDIQAEGGDLE